MTIYDVDNATFAGGSAGSDRSRGRLVLVVKVRRDDTFRDHR